jgi:hypothetical protein
MFRLLVRIFPFSSDFSGIFRAEKQNYKIEVFTFSRLILVFLCVYLSFDRINHFFLN